MQKPDRVKYVFAGPPKLPLAAYCWNFVHLRWAIRGKLALGATDRSKSKLYLYFQIDIDLKIQIDSKYPAFTHPRVEPLMNKNNSFSCSLREQSLFFQRTKAMENGGFSNPLKNWDFVSSLCQVNQFDFKKLCSWREQAVIE